VEKKIIGFIFVLFSFINFFTCFF